MKMVWHANEKPPAEFPPLISPPLPSPTEPEPEPESEKEKKQFSLYDGRERLGEEECPTKLFVCCRSTF